METRSDSLKEKRTVGLLLILLSAGISLWWGIPLGREIPGGANDLQVVYYATQCLMRHGDPYQLDQLRRVYVEEERKLPGSIERPLAVTWYIYLPPAFLLIAPLAVLPWPIAFGLWMALLAGAMVLAGFLVMREALPNAPRLALCLVCLVLINCEVGFALGNSALLVVSFCTIAAWCLVQKQHVFVAVVLLATALAIKPHDAGLVWLYFLLSGGAHRKRALQSFAVTAALGLAAALWVVQVAPHWLAEWNANVSVLTARGGISDPGLSAEKEGGAGQVIDLQSALAVIKDDPSFYNPISNAVCGAMFLIWIVTTLRARDSANGVWYALASAVPLTLLATYHRPYDAKLLLLAIPACARLWSEGNPTGRMALALTTAAIAFTADVPLVIWSNLTGHWDIAKMGLMERMLLMPVLRPAPLALLALSVFYLWVYVRKAGVVGAGASSTERDSMQPVQAEG